MNVRISFNDKYILKGFVYLMATIKDIARELSISAQAVSRGLNDKNNISDSLKEKIRLKAKELGYTKNQVAASLKTKETKLIGIFMFKRTFEIRQKVFEGIFAEARRHKYDVLFFTMDSELDRSLSYSELCKQRMVDGVIFTGIRMDDPHIDELKDMEIPTVILDTEIGGKCNTVSMDHEKAMSYLVNYLKQNGHSEIGLITGHKQADISNKVVGYYKNNLSPKNGFFIEYSDYSEKTGYLCAKSMLNSSERPTAIIAINNSVAMGIMKYAEECDIRIPEDLALVQLNDITISSLIKIPITSMYQNDFKRGKIAVQLITGKCEGEKILVDPVFKLRSSA
jgi:LacI family transcriptional regulator